jgi:uncharacterized protein YjiS (DUF1127 family)
VHKSAAGAYIGLVKNRNEAASAKGGRKARSTTMSRNINSLYTRYRRWRRYRETVRELESLSTHELNDLGINRGEISRLAREASRL